MRPVIPVALIAGALLLLSFTAYGADAVKFGHRATVYADAKNGALKYPEGIACNDKGDFIVADTSNGRLVRYSLKDEGVSGGEEIRTPQLSTPIRLQLTQLGDIFALDAKQRRIVHLAVDGTFSGYLDPKGIPGAAPAIRSFKVDADGSFYLLDIFGERVIQLDRDGNFLRQLPFPTGHGSCSDLAVDDKGTILLLDSTRAMLYAAARDAAVFTPLTKELHEYANFPATLTLNSRGTIYLVDRNGGGIVIIGRDGGFLGRQLSMGERNGFLSYAGQICINGRGMLMVADTGNSRVQLFGTER